MKFGNKSILPKWIFIWGAILTGPISDVSAQVIPAIRAARFVSRRHRVIRRIPRGFHVEQKLIHLWKYGYSWTFDSLNDSWKRFSKTGQVGALLRSDDRQCEVIYSVALVFDNHRSWLRNDLLNISQGQDTARFEDHVTVMTGQAVRPFNADSIFLLELPIEPMERDGSLYTRCVRMYLTRKGHTFLDFVWFFTDEGYARRQEYLRAIEGKVYFKKRQESPHRPTK